jgi:hypothetical protein
MSGILVAGFWIWFACSVVILLRRAFRRSRTGRAPRPGTRPRPAAAPAGPPDRADAEDHAVVAAGAAASNDVIAPSAVAAKTRTIADVLRGMSLPCDLGPLTVPGSTIDFERRAAFYTVSHPAEVVGTAVADELERIGMHFAALTHNTGLATRGDVMVRVGVHSIGPSINGVADLGYPTAPPHSVVVDIELA